MSQEKPNESQPFQQNDLRRYFEEQCDLSPEEADLFAQSWQAPGPTLDQFYQQRWGGLPSGESEPDR